MRDKLLALYQLQRIDSAVFEHERSAEAIPKKIKELEDALEVPRMELGQLNAEADALKKEQRDLEALISEESGKHHKWKHRLNDIKSPREYQALSREIELGERQVRDHEEKTMEVMGNYEAQRKIIDAKESEFKALERSHRSKIEELRAMQLKAQEKADKAKHGRDDVTSKIPPGFVKRYDQVRKRRNGLGIGVVTGGVCSGCHVKLRAQLLVQILKHNSIESCPGCNRYLVHEELVAELEGTSED